MSSAEDERLKGLCPNCLEPNGGTFPCPACGFVPSEEQEGWNRLRPGTLLQDRYLIGGILGRGGFGITYRGKDLRLELPLAIKEYFPAGLAARESTSRQVSASGSEDAEDFRQGMDRFLDEAKLLARFESHPTIVSVRDHFRANGTAYMVMPLLEGVTFERYLKNKGGRIPFEQALSILMPVMDALEQVHAAGLIHRDVSPDNIFITTSGQIRLLDFGAAKTAAALAARRSHSIVLKKGYSPPEQYQSRGNLGPWTDVYGLAATLYRAVTGQIPPDAMDRIDEDILVAPGTLGIPFPPSAEAGLLQGLAISSKNRPQSIREFQDYLMGSASPAAGIPSPGASRGSGGTAGMLAAPGVPDSPTAFVPAAPGSSRPSDSPSSVPGAPVSPATGAAPGRAPSRAPKFLLLGGVLAAALLGAAFFLLGGSEEKKTVPPSDSVVAEASPAPKAFAPTAEPTEPPKVAPREDPTRVVLQFYRFLDGGRLRDAYALLSQGKRAKVPYDVWASGYGQTESQQPEQINLIEAGPDRAKVRFVLHAVDRTSRAGVLVDRRYEGIWRLVPVDGRWRMDSASVRLITHKYVMTEGEPDAEESGQAGVPLKGRVVAEDASDGDEGYSSGSGEAPSAKVGAAPRPPVPTAVPRQPVPTKRPAAPPVKVPGGNSLAEGLRLFKARQYAQAAPILERAIAGGNNDIRVYRALALAYMEQGAYDRAVDVTKNSILADPSNPEMRRIAAMAYYRKGDRERAVDAAERAVHVDRRDFESWKFLAELLIRAGHSSSEAAKACAGAIGVNPNDPEVRYWRACLSLEEKSLEGARPDYEALRRMGSPLADKLRPAFPEDGSSSASQVMEQINRILSDFKASFSS
jgi:serine/threonine protein kinase